MKGTNLIKWIKDLKEQTRIIKLLKEGTGEALGDLGSGRDFWDVMHNAQVITDSAGRRSLRDSVLKGRRAADGGAACTSRSWWGLASGRGKKPLLW